MIFRTFGGGSTPTDPSYLSGRAAVPQIASVGSNHSGTDRVTIQHLVVF